MDKPQVNPSWRSTGYNAESFAGSIFRAVAAVQTRCGGFCGVANIARRIAPQGLSILRISLRVRAW
ncbi:conserved protein of unknown function [Pseudomonas marincola]|uniref:Uncharacterized protein n=1 Tax=Pseudomonas marincola TaxID=437900 RepID=A0A653E2J8_9PSED|nr:conserved protein of unknown function [Pseudomonas marincola]